MCYAYPKSSFFLENKVEFEYGIQVFMKENKVKC